MPDDSSAQLRLDEEHNGKRIDRVVAHLSGVSRRVARIWIGEGRVRVDGRIMRILSRTVRAGQRIAYRG